MTYYYCFFKILDHSANFVLTEFVKKATGERRFNGAVGRGEKMKFISFRRTVSTEIRLFSVVQKKKNPAEM